MSISTIVDIERKSLDMLVEFKLTTGLVAVLAALAFTSSGITAAPAEINAIEYSESYTIEPTQSGNGLLIIDSHRGCELICNQ